MKNYYKNKKVLILGLGKTGISCINFFKKKKSNIYAIDENKEKNIKNIKLNSKNIFLGCIKISWILSSDFIIISPGFNLNKPEIKIAKLYNKKILNDINIFLEEKKYKNIIAITGSNGKSTTSYIIYKVLKKNNLNVILCGNFGYPVLNTINKKYDFHIIELSSFQLELISNIKTFISLIINISYNHIDRHNNFEYYKKIKHKIYKNSKNCIFNYDDINTWPIKKKNINYLYFSVFKGKYKLKFNKKNISIYKNNNKFLNCNNINLKGIHNYINILASIIIFDLININNENQKNIIKKIKPLKHRINIYKKKNNIIFVNDSKSTNPISTISAINSFNNYNYNYIHLIIGGISKNNDFKILSNYIKYKKIILYLFGKDRYLISKNFSNNLYICRENLIIIVKIILNNIKKNDIVLLSPSCSSFDQYKSFEYRGNRFISLIRNYI